MKRFIRPSTILIVSIILLGFFSVAFSRSMSTQASRFTNQTGAGFFFQTTPTPQVEEDKSEIGSTDGITLMSFLIFSIILIPILLQRKSWSEV